MIKDKPVLYLALAQTLIWASLVYVFPAMLLHWESAFGWGRSQLTGAITLAVFMSAFVSPLVGELIDRGRGPQVMTVCSIVGGVCLFALSWISSPLQFYLIWIFIGVMHAGCLYEPCFALVTRSRGTHAKKSITMITLVAGFASTISFPMTHWLAGEFGWSTAIRVFALITVFLGAPLLWLGSYPLERHARHKLAQSEQPRANRAFLRQSAFWCLAVGFALLAILHGITLHHLLPILQENGIATSVAVLVASLIGPMQVAGRVVMLWLEPRLSNHSIAIACFVAMASSIVLLIWSKQIALLVYGFVALFGGAYGMVSILRPVIAREILGESQFGTKSGVLAMVYLVGVASAPLSGSLIWVAGGYQLVLPAIILFAIIGLFFYLAASRSSRPC